MSKDYTYTWKDFFHDEWRRFARYCRSRPEVLTLFLLQWHTTALDHVFRESCAVIFRQTPHFQEPLKPLGPWGRTLIKINKRFQSEPVFTFGFTKLQELAYFRFQRTCWLAELHRRPKNITDDYPEVHNIAWAPNDEGKKLFEIGIFRREWKSNSFLSEDNINDRRQALIFKYDLA